MFSNRYFFFKILVICLIFISFFLGYFLRENSAGGGLEFYQLSWPIIQSFKSDFLFTINNYGSFGDGTIPFSHIINAYLNPSILYISPSTVTFTLSFFSPIMVTLAGRGTKLILFLIISLCIIEIDCSCFL